MTKLLHITSGQYVKFLSSIKYDRVNHIEGMFNYIECYEDSYMYENNKQSIEEYLKNGFQNGGATVTYKDSPLTDYNASEFEIIYD